MCAAESVDQAFSESSNLYNNRGVWLNSERNATFGKGRFSYERNMSLYHDSVHGTTFKHMLKI